MKFPRNVSRAALLAVAVLAAGCSDITAVDQHLVPEESLTFVRFGDNAPPLAETEVSFVAVRGQEREAQIRYLNPVTQQPYKCMRFVVPAQALLRYPDGRPFAEGDSVRITIRLAEPGRFTFEFEPSGLRFDPANPARLEVMHAWANRDFNGDGVVDELDEPIAQGFGFWRQERPGDPWALVATERDADLQEAGAAITGFTIYALASE